MHYTYRTSGTCSSKIDFEINDGVITDVVFTNGCNGNLKAIGKLVEGKPAAEIADILRGNDCQNRGTSCADQRAIAIEAALKKESSL